MIDAMNQVFVIDVAEAVTKFTSEFYKANR